MKTFTKLCTTLLTVALMAISLNSSAQVVCTNCTSNDFTFQQFFIGDGAHNQLTPCNTGNPVNAHLWMQVTSNATRYSLWVDYDIKVTNLVTNTSVTTHVNTCLYEHVAIPNTFIDLGVISWTCGNKVEIINFVMSWKQNASLSCGYDSPKCYCLATLITANTPLSVGYQYSKSCTSGSGSTVNFTSTVSGGTAPYTYSWNFGDAGTSTLQNPAHLYTTPGTYTVTLTAKDNLGTTGTYTSSVVIPSQLVLTSTMTSTPSCSNPVVGAGYFTASGGTAPFTFEALINTSNATFSQSGNVYNFSNAGPGTITIKVTDANSCSASSTVTLAGTDTQPPSITCPQTKTIEGCNTASITVANTGLAFSATKTTISSAQFSATGAIASDDCGIVKYEYQDAATGTCPVNVTRTFTVTDGTGKSATCTQSIIVKDTQKPVISTTAANTDLGCNPTVVAPIFTGNDNCYGNFTPTVTTAGATNTGCAYSQTWKANFTDACGNIADEKVITYTWKVDTEKPVISTTATSKDLGCNPTVVAPVFTGNDNCDGNFTPTVTTTGLTNTGCAYSQTWKANYKDACGNIADEKVITYTWKVDNEKPVISTSASNTDLGCNPIQIVAPVFTGSDNCDGNFTPTVTTAGATNTGCAYSQTWKANYKDACGNIADEKVITYTWKVDTEKPVISTTATNTDLGCNPTVVAPVFNGNDNCEGSFTPTVTTAGATNTSGCTYSQTWKANYTDGCNNKADEVSITYTWTTDHVKPVISTTAVSGDLGYNPTIVEPVFTGIDNCAGEFSPNVTTSGATNVGCAFTQSWYANYNDPCGNIADQVTITYTWTVDTDKPVISTTAVSGDKKCNPTIVAPEFNGIDNCAGAFSPDIFTAGPTNVGCAYSQTWVATYKNGAGISADPLSITYNWTQDTEVPVITTTAQSGDLGCNPEVVTPEFTGTDNCEGIIIPNVSSDGPSHEGCAYSQTWKANYTDVCGNKANEVSITYTWTVDTEKPVITTNDSDKDLGCNPEIIEPVFTGTDDCEGTIIPVVTSEGPVHEGCAYSQTWYANYKDACGNAADQVSVTYTWKVDKENPVITAESSNHDLGCNPEVTAPSFKGSDNCEGIFSPIVTTDGPSNTGNVFSQTWNANYTDACGNKAEQVSVTYTWTVDTEKPIITTTAQSGDKGCNPQIQAPAFAGTDNIEGTIIPVVTSDGPTHQGCAYTQTWFANYTDGCGNKSDQVSVTYTWKVDTEKPIITTNASNKDLGCNPEVVAPEFTGTDNCEGIIVPLVSSDGPSHTGCAYSQTWKANFTDACGNKANEVSITYTWTVDTEKPVITTNETNKDLGCNPEVVKPVFSGTDNCEGTIIPVVTSEGPVHEGCAYSQTWYANYKDACGNAADQVSVTYTWTSDLEKPTASNPKDIVLEGCNGQFPAADISAVTDAADNCSTPAVSFVSDGEASMSGCVETIIRTYRITDACGNSIDVHQKLIRIVDQTPPVLTWVQSIEVNNDKGVCNAKVIVPTPLADDCNKYTLVNDFNQTTDASGVYPVGNTTVKWIATDICGNTSSCSMVITVIDNEAPAITCPDAVKFCETEEVKLGQPIVNDNCGIQGIINDAPAKFKTGITSVTWTVTDIHNNVSTCVQKVEVVPQATVEVGPGLITCEGQSVYMNSTVVTNYSSFVWVHDGKGTLLNDNTLYPTYVPAQGETGNVGVALFVQGLAPCSNVKDQTVITIVPMAVVNAGPDASICENQTYMLNSSSVSNAKSVNWTTSGTGTFKDATALHTEYYPSVADIEAGSIVLTLTAIGNNPCGYATDNLKLTIIKAAKVDAGADLSSCDVAPVQLLATASEYSSVKWTTSGTGTFSNAGILNPVYTPSAADVAAGSVTLSIEVAGNQPCGSASDILILSLSPMASVAAGADQQGCDLSAIQLAGIASNYSSVLWTSAGSGTFDHADVLNAVYTPSEQDLEKGSVVLTLTAFGKKPCGEMSDALTIELKKSPVAHAGAAISSCKLSPVQLQGMTSNAASFLWTSSGTGTFDNASKLDAVYTPSAKDLADGSVELTLTAEGTAPCGQATDKVKVTFVKGPSVYAGSDAAQCVVAPFTLSHATVSDYSSFKWTHNGTGTLSDANILSPIYTPSANEHGVITFTLTANGASACGDITVSDDVRLTIFQAPTVNAGDDQTINSGTSALLNAVVSGGSGNYAFAWNPANLVNDATLQSTSTKALTSNTEFTISVSDLDSRCSASDAVLITVKEVVYDPPQAIDDNATTNINTSVNVAILANDIDPRGLGLTPSILTNPKHGTVELNADGTIKYTPETNWLGYDTLTYQICDKASTPRCASAKVVILTQGTRPFNQIIVYNIVTPNGDNKNDRWIIKYIEEFPNNSAIIFNRWGDKINEYTGYNNTTRSWDATDKNGKRVPDGTYYYILKIAGDEPRTGWILVTGNVNSD